MLDRYFDHSATVAGSTGPGSPSPVEFRDTTGRQWTVFERPCADVPGQHGRRCLVFECNDAVRRVRDYPADWRKLDPAGLERLSWRA